MGIFKPAVTQKTIERINKMRVHYPENKFAMRLKWYLLAVLLILGSAFQPFAQTEKDLLKKSKLNNPSESNKSNFKSEDKLYSQESQRLRAKSFHADFTKARQSGMDVETKLISKSGQEKMNTILVKMAKEVPLSEEYHYANYVNSNYATSEISELDRAYQVADDKSIYYADYIAHFELVGNKSKKSEFCHLLNKSGIVSEGVLAYNYNVLMSIEENGILFVNGSDDTYPIWIHQQNKIRTDITILNTDLLGDDSYRKKKMLELGITEELNYNADRKAYMKSIAKNNPQKPIYFGLTVSPALIKEIKAELYLTGLALKYSRSTIENIPILQGNWENKFNTLSLNKEHTNSTVRKMNMNYMLPLLLLSETYNSQGNESQAVLCNNLAINLAKEGGKEKVIKQYLDKRE